MAGAMPVGGLDMWDLAVETYALNFPTAKTYHLKADELCTKRLQDEVGAVDLLLASPECTSHSVAKGNKPRCELSRATAFEVVRFARALRPRWIVVENVMQMQRWDRFEDWHRQLKNLGYKTNFDILDAQYHRTPQTRRRLFLVADLEREPNLPEAKTPTIKTVDSAIIGKGEPASRPWAFSPVNNYRRAKATIERADRAIAELGNDVPFIMVYYGTDGAGGFQTLDRPLRTVTTLDRFAYVKPNGSGHEMRMLQPPELAAAMGFPKSHKWPKVSRRERIKLIGNAVCPHVMKDVIQTLVGE